ncbi:MAG: Ig-like domain-containing protein, partial [Myxococcota bacterium]|nr:Ig-like domain-containing protein [Myxococcota bacterium]
MVNPHSVRARMMRILVGLTLILSPLSTQAQQPTGTLFDGPVVHLLPLGQTVGDGSSQVRLAFLCLDETGSPCTDLKGKVGITGGEVGEMSAAGPGRFEAVWVPPVASSLRNVEVTLRGRIPGKGPIQGSWTVPVVPPPSPGIDLQARPQNLVIGQDGGTTITATLASGGAVANSADLEFLTNGGTISNITHMGNGTFTAQYTPDPKKRFPHLDQITVADRQSPTATYGSLTIRLLGKVNFPVIAVPRAQVLLNVGGKDFGPVTSDAAGKASVDIEVHPGKSKAKMVVVDGEKRAETDLDLMVPPSKRVRLLPLPTSLPSSTDTPLPIRAYVTTPSGEPDPSAKVSFSATAGAMSSAIHEGGGIYMATLTPANAQTASKLTLQVSVEDAASKQADSLTLTTVPVRPQSVQLTPEPATLAEGSGEFQIFAKVLSPDGTGMANRAPSFDLTGASAIGAVKDLGNGDYKARFKASGQGPVHLVATVRSPASTNPIRHLFVIPARNRLPNDGLSSSTITIVSTDEFGLPVPGVQVALSTSGDGSIPQSATTDDHGIAQVRYTAGKTANLVTIKAASGSQSGSGAMLQAPMTAAPGVSLAPSGSRQQVKLQHQWSSLVRALHVGRQGGAPIAAAPMAAADPWSNPTPAAEPPKAATIEDAMAETTPAEAPPAAAAAVVQAPAAQP